MIDLTVIPVLLGLGILGILMLVVFEHWFGYSRGVGLGAFELLMEYYDGTYERKQRSLNDVSKSTLNGVEIFVENLKWWMEQPECNIDRGTKDLFIKLAAREKPQDYLAGLGLELRVLVASSVTRGNFLLCVLHRTRDKYGNALSFPDSNARVRKRRSLSFSDGLVSKRLLRLISYRLPVKLQIEGLSKKPFRTYFAVPHEDARVADTAQSIEKYGPAIVQWISAVPNYRIFGAEIKTLQERTKGLLSELKRAQNKEKRAAGDAFEDSKSAKVISDTVGNESKQPMAARVPVVLMIFPIAGAALFEYVFQSNAIFGVIVGAVIAVAILGGKR